MLDDNGKPKVVNVRIGLADGTYSELVSGELKEGAQVIVGTQADAKGRAQQTKGGPRFGF
jgi:HlyD family secretion protein